MNFPRAIFAPAFHCVQRSTCPSIMRTGKLRAISSVESVLPLSTIIASMFLYFWAKTELRQAGRVGAELNVPIMTDTVGCFSPVFLPAIFTPAIYLGITEITFPTKVLNNIRSPIKLQFGRMQNWRAYLFLGNIARAQFRCMPCQGRRSGCACERGEL